MNNNINIIKWATDSLVSKGYSLHLPEIIQETPWSNVIRFTTEKGDFYLKQPAPLLAQEAKVLQLLALQFNARVPAVIAINDDLHCFLMKDAGLSLRKHLQNEFHPDLLCQAIKKFTAFQRSTENNIKPFLALDVADWRLNKLPQLYEQIINQVDFLKADGMTDKEQQTLHDLSSHISKEFKLLSEYNIPETIVQPDFNTNNILICRDTNQFTFIDLGELAITHPFFSLHNSPYAAIIDLLDIYSDYLISQNHYATATGLAAMFDGEISHDQVSRHLRSGEFGSKELWTYVKSDVRRHEQKTGGVLLLDDTISEKAYTDENDCLYTINRQGF